MRHSPEGSAVCVAFSAKLGIVFFASKVALGADPRPTLEGVSQPLIQRLLMAATCFFPL